MNSFGKVCIRIGVIVLIFGIVTTALGFGFGGKLDLAESKVGKLIDFDDTYDDVKSIDLDINYAKINIKNGESFKIETDDVEEKSFQNYIDDDGTWVIKDNNKENGFQIFGWNFSEDGINVNDKYNPEITIYVPKDFKAENLNIILGAGNANIEELKAEKATFDIGAGSISIDKIALDEDSLFKVGAGSIVISDINANDVKFESGTGKMDVDGTITGDSDINCGVGKITMNLKGDEKDYNYSVDCGIGNVIINNNKYTFSEKTSTDNKDAKYDFDLKCGVGAIELYIN